MTLRLLVPASRAQYLLLGVVFVLFACHALGIVELGSEFARPFRINRPLLDGLVRGRVPPGLFQLDVTCFLVVNALLTVALPVLSPIAASLLALAAMVPPFYVAWTYPVPPAVVPMEYTLLTTLMLFAVNVLANYFQETHRKQKLMAVFGQYVPPPLVDELARRPRAPTLAGEAREMSVMFCDIQGFAAIAERLSATELAALLNDYLTAMTAVLHAHGATIDKYIGDAIMAFWGAPLRQPDHADRAMAAALAMQLRMHTLRAEYARRGWPELVIGIGIASGVVNVGNMGSRYRVAYTVIGDTVNLAARLEALTRLYGCDILVSAGTREAAPARHCREIDHVRVKGKGRAIRIYEPLPAERGASAEDAAVAAALTAYYRGDWDEARGAFEALAAAAPADRYPRAMLARLALPRPPPGWDGVVVFDGSRSHSFGERTDGSA